MKFKIIKVDRYLDDKCLSAWYEVWSKWFLFPWYHDNFLEMYPTYLDALYIIEKRLRYEGKEKIVRTKLAVFSDHKTVLEEIERVKNDKPN